MAKVGVPWLVLCATLVAVPAQGWASHDPQAGDPTQVPLFPPPPSHWSHFPCNLSAVAQPLKHTHEESHPGRTGLSPPSVRQGDEASPAPWPCGSPTGRPGVRVMKSWGSRWPTATAALSHPFRDLGRRHALSFLGPRAARGAPGDNLSRRGSVIRAAGLLLFQD